MTRTAQNYADALYELAADEGLSQRLHDELEEVRGLFDANADYVRLLSTPNLPKAERLAALDAALGGRVHPYLLSFLKLLCERSHLRELDNCALRYRRRYNAEAGILEAVAVTAVPLRPELAEKLTARLSGLIGKRVSLRNRVEPAVLGGIRLEYDGQALDGTVQQRLRGIEKTLSDTVL